MTILSNYKKFPDLRLKVSPVKFSSLGPKGSADHEPLFVSRSIDPDNLRHLLETLANEDCMHSWKNFDTGGTLKGLLEWENKLRPTTLFFFYRETAGEMRLVAASAVADKLTQNFPHPGFCVIGRCYIMPEFRCCGYYRQVLQYRLEHCREQFGNALNAIHIGSINERVSRVITNHGFAGWPRFIHLGEEKLKVGGEFGTVGAYLMLMPEYLSRIRKALVGNRAPECAVNLRNVLSRIESTKVRDFGVLVKETFEEASADGWFDDRSSEDIEQFLAFCRSIPLIGFVP